MEAVKTIKWAIEKFGIGKIALATSLSAEDQVLTDMILSINEEAQIFTLDTGRLPEETYEVIKETNKRYGINIEMVGPEAEDVDAIVKENGKDLFYDSIEKRQLCCYVRKIAPLKKRLQSLSAWMTGLRREQSVTRDEVERIEDDETFDLVKINPLVDWTEEEVWNYIKEKNIPYNKLYDEGYRSIGCAPCTRAIEPGDDVRAGRWWWEPAHKKECGLHIKNGKVVRDKI